ncbi:MAG: outer membrane protein transport protein [Pseudomonadales bacterium]|nr:outer membrane protein transport protein [Pseudomonadales bacterium]
MNIRIIKTAVLFSFLLISTQSSAQLFQNLLIGNAKALALGQAVTADPPGIDSIHFNPAGLSRLKGRQFEIKVIAADFSLIGEFDLNDEFLKKRYEELGYTDPLDGGKSEVQDMAVYLPGLGFTEVPTPIIPLGGVSYNRQGSKWTFANSAYAPLAFGLSRAEDDPGSVHGRKLAISHIAFFTPSVAYQVTDTLSIGMTMTFNYSALIAEVNYRNSGGVIREASNFIDQVCDPENERDDYVWEVPSDLLNICEGGISPFEGLFEFRTEMKKSVGVGFNFGILWDATNWLSLGLAYQAEQVDYLKGFMQLDFREEEALGLLGLLKGLEETSIVGLNPILEYFELPEDGNIEEAAIFKLVTPQHLAFGMSMRILPKLKLNIDVKWTETSTWESLAFQTNGPVGVLRLFTLLQLEGANVDGLAFKRDYVDTVNWGFGLEYTINQKTLMRLGFEPRKTGIPYERQDFTIPVADVDVYAFGFSRQISKTSSFDITFAMATSSMDIPAGASETGNNHREINNFIYHPTAGLDLKSNLDIFLIETSYRKHF